METSAECGKIEFDRSRVRILLCERDQRMAQEVKELLCRCSYQVSVVKTARQVVEVLNLSDSKVDLVLSEVELPNGKGLKMLKHLVKRDDFKHIPIVMMSAHDEMAIVVKCLRLGAADYLVKPLRVNELLNLWTHMWRRRRMLGLTEKHIVKGSMEKNIIAEIFVSDTSESNTLSDIFSEDSNDVKFMSKESAVKPILEETEVLPDLELSLKPSAEEAHKTQFRNQAADVSPRKSSLKLGQSSAFLTYARRNSTSMMEKAEVTNETAAFRVPTNVPMPRIDQASTPHKRALDAESQKQGQHKSSEDEQRMQQQQQIQQQYIAMQMTNDPRNNGVTMFSPVGQPHVMQQMMVAHYPALQYYHQAAAEASMNVAAATAAGLHPPGFSYYPFLHVPQAGSWPSLPPSAAPTQMPNIPVERRAGVAGRREAALNKFRQKRKDRCFEKKIRYASRKRLAEQRPRVKGQFVRRTEEYEEEEEDDDEETGGRDLSPESGVDIIQ